MKIKTIIQQPIATNGYVITNGKESIIIDPGSVEDKHKFDEATEGELLAIILTHAHFDHALAAHTFEVPTYMSREEYGQLDFHKTLTRSWMGKEFIIPEEIRFLEPKMSVGNISFEVIDTPGHTKGGVCLLFEDFILTGDTLFAQSYGRTDIGGDEESLMKSLKRLSELPEDLIVYPGHGPQTTIGREKPWLLKMWD